MILNFRTHGNEKQKLAAKYWIDNTTTNLIYGGSKGSGKSYLGISLIFGDAFIYPETQYFIARKQLTDLRNHTIPSVHEVLRDWGLTEKYYKYNGKDNYFTLNNGSKVFFLSAKYLPSDPLYYRFGSMQMTRGMIEEAGQFDKPAKDNLFASIGRCNNEKYGLTPKLLETCNPAKNYLYEIYKRHKENKLEDHIKFIQALPSDNKKIDKGYLENLHRILSVYEKERLLFGNWEYDDDPNALIKYESIIDLFNNDFVKPGEKAITADIARYGADKFVIMLWDGLRVDEIHSYSKSSIDFAVNKIKELALIKGIPNSRIVIDDDGVGGGVTDFIKNCKRFINNSSALNNENYKNLKTQCYYKLAEYINNHKIYVNCDSEQIKTWLTEELEQVKMIHSDSDHKKQIVNKETVSKLLGRSPDFSDCLMMRMFLEFKPSVNHDIAQPIIGRVNYEDIF